MYDVIFIGHYTLFDKEICPGCGPVDAPAGGADNTNAAQNTPANGEAVKGTNIHFIKVSMTF